MTTRTTARILVVDDSKVSRNMAVGLIRLRRPEAEILEAGDGAQAIALAAEHLPDLVIMDVNMPGMTGIEAATFILQERPDATVVLLTANIQAATQAKAEAAGVILYKKPIKGEVIDQILSHLTVNA
jgi:two-component system, chemotaxis family, chemotaxis protein CheY